MQAASDVAAGIHITTDTGAAAGAALQIEFDQQGNINGTAAVRIATDAAEGSYSLYWLNPDSLTIQSAGSGRIASGHAEISVHMGGRYWLSENVVRLDGNAADGSVEAVASGSGQTETAAGGNGSSESSGGVPDPADIPHRPPETGSHPEARVLPLRPAILRDHPDRL